MNSNFKNIKIYTDEETLDKLIGGYSIARYGDGEIKLCYPNKKINFQDYNQDLTEELQKILSFEKCHEKLLVGIPPLIFEKYDGYTKHAVNWWKNKYNSSNIRNQFIKDYVDFDKQYGSSFISRITEILNVDIIINKFKQIYKNKNIVYITNKKILTSMEPQINFFFGTAKSISAYAIPEKNAWDVKNDILTDIINKYDSSHIIFCSAGPTATILAYYFTLAGYQFIDLGHMISLFPDTFDIEK